MVTVCPFARCPRQDYCVSLATHLYGQHLSKASPASSLEFHYLGRWKVWRLLGLLVLCACLSLCLGLHLLGSGC